MPDSSVLLFGGMALGGPASSSATRDQPPLCILNAAEFTAEFRRWLSTVYPQYTDAPRTPEQLASFDKWTLAPKFRADYESGKLVNPSGVSIEEVHLGLQLELSAPAISLVSNRYTAQPLGRISRKQILPSEHIARLLEDSLPPTGGTLTVVLLVYDGHFGHSIVAFGADRERHCVRFLDPWPGGTLLAGDRNAAGVDAFPDPAFPGGWQIETSQLAKVLVAALVPLSFWNRWQDKSGSARDERPRRMETAAESALFERLSRLSANPESRSALGSAALALALVLAAMPRALDV